MSDEPLDKTIETRLAEMAQKSIKADAAHLVETIKRQFSNADEYVRELVVNGIDAGATIVDVHADVIEHNGAAFARIRIIDNGKGMSFDDVKSYLTVFESRKDGTRQAVGKHGVGKLSPWAQDDLVSYVVDTCDGKERTELRMTSVRDGIIRRYSGAGERGTSVELLWSGDKPLDIVRKKISAAQRVLKKYCRYATAQIRIDTVQGDESGFTLQTLTAPPQADGWRELQDACRSCPSSRIYYRFGSDYGLHLYQGGIFVVCKTDLFDGSWPLRQLEIMVESHLFQLPISRNDVIEDVAYCSLKFAIEHETIPEIMRNICARIDHEYRREEGLDMTKAEELIVQYLSVNPAFRSAQGIRLFPLLPFGRASVAQISAERSRSGSIMICACDPGEYTPVAGRKLVIDQARLSGDMKGVLEKHFAPLMEVSWSEEVMEAPDTAHSGALSPLERRFQESLTLLSGGFDLNRDDILGAAVRLGIASGKSLSAAIGEALGAAIGDYGARSGPDLPDIRFRLTRLTRLDGKTPVNGVRFQIRDNVVLLNLNSEEIRAHLAFAQKDPDLAAHWCLRELILSDRLSCFKHLSYDACETLVHSDAVARLGQSGLGDARTVQPPARREKSYWNDDADDWKRYQDD